MHENAANCCLPSVILAIGRRARSVIAGRRTMSGIERTCAWISRAIVGILSANLTRSGWWENVECVSRSGHRRSGANRIAHSWHRLISSRHSGTKP